MSTLHKLFRLLITAAVVPVAYVAAFYASIVLACATVTNIHSDGLGLLLALGTTVGGTAAAFFGARWTWRALGDRSGRRSMKSTQPETRT